MTEQKHELTEQEADLYDRQIRLWGLESQKKLRAADVLLIGVRTLGSEIAKNILLSGIKSLTFLDDGKVTEEDLTSNFLLPRNSNGKNIAEAVVERAQNLNPMVEISADSTRVQDKSEAFYKKFTIVIATRLPVKQLIAINKNCRRHGTQFICGDVFGMFGYTFSDLQEHEFYEDVIQFLPNKKRKLNIKSEKVEQATVRVVKTHKFIPLEDALGTDWLSDDKKKVNKLSSWYFLTRALLKFRDVHQRNLSLKEKESDLEKLKEIRTEIFKELDVPYDKLPEDMNIIFGEAVPVCAIVGGVLAQEVIKAVSHNEAPINNMFFFDPHNYSGKIECVGI